MASRSKLIDHPAYQFITVTKEQVREIQEEHIKADLKAGYTLKDAKYLAKIGTRFLTELVERDKKLAKQRKKIRLKRSG